MANLHGYSWLPSWYWLLPVLILLRNTAIFMIMLIQVNILIVCSVVEHTPSTLTVGATNPAIVFAEKTSSSLSALAYHAFGVSVSNYRLKNNLNCKYPFDGAQLHNLLD
jgi:hypothetical protein